jgi:hypothetical protein
LFTTKLFVTVTQKKAVRVIERAYRRYRDRLRSIPKLVMGKNPFQDPAQLVKYVPSIILIVRI